MALTAVKKKGAERKDQSQVRANQTASGQAQEAQSDGSWTQPAANSWESEGQPAQPASGSGNGQGNEPAQPASGSGNGEGNEPASGNDSGQGRRSTRAREPDASHWAEQPPWPQSGVWNEDPASNSNVPGIHTINYDPAYETSQGEPPESFYETLLLGF